MGRIYLEFKDNKWNKVSSGDYWMDAKLHERLDNLKKIKANGWDGLIIVDGRERSGKSILAMIMGWYLSDTHMTINNFSRGIKDVANKIDKLPDGSVLILDEAGTVFASADGQTRWQKNLIKILEVVGQKNMIFILCLPRFYKLKDDIAVHRALFLCHVYPRKSDWKRGQYVYFGEEKKAKLYVYARKNYGSYAWPPADDEPAEYPDFNPPFYTEYLNTVKKESLQEVIDIAKGDNSPDNKRETKADMIKIEAEFYGYLRDVLNLKTKDMEKIRGQKRQTIHERILYYREKIANNSNLTKEVDEIEADDE